MYLEDFEVDKTYSTGRIYIHEALIYEFAMQYDSQPFHLDPNHPTTKEMGGLFSSGYQSLALALRLTIESGMFDHNYIGLGLDEVRWLSPVFAGITVSVDNRIISAVRSKSRPERGIVKIEQLMKNVDDNCILMRAVVSLMVNSKAC